jgi:plastocyanin
MRRRLLVCTALATLAGASPTFAQHGGGPAGHEVQASVLTSAVTPLELNVLAGDTVTWTNVSFSTHTVTADAGDWSSGSLNNSDKFSHTFTTPGSLGYYCRFHLNIRGTVNVYNAILDRPAGPAAPNRPFGLSGRTTLPQGTAITIEGDTGSGFTTVANTTAAADGTFAARLPSGVAGNYRAVAGGQATPPVQVVVLDHTLDVTLGTSDPKVRSLRVEAKVTPPAPGLKVVLQLKLRERFGWWPDQTKKLGSGTATFTTSGSRKVDARVVLTLPDGATILAVSKTFKAPAPR